MEITLSVKKSLHIPGKFYNSMRKVIAEKYVIYTIGLLLTYSCNVEEHKSGCLADIPCDPLIPEVVDIELGEIISIGEDIDGTIYLLDSFKYENLGSTPTRRLFVLQNEILVRQKPTATGSGIDDDGNEYYSFFFAMAGFHKAFYVTHIDESVYTTRICDLGEDWSYKREPTEDYCHPLKIVDSKILEGMTISGLPSYVQVLYRVQIQGGNQLLLLLPEIDGVPTEYKLFYGSSETMRECQIEDIIQFMSGSIQAWFTTCDNREAVLRLYPENAFGSGSKEEDSFFQLEGNKKQVTLLSTEDFDINETQYSCF